MIEEVITEGARRFNLRCKHFQFTNVNEDLGRELMRMFAACDKMFTEAGPEHYAEVLLKLQPQGDQLHSISELITLITTLHTSYNSIVTAQKNSNGKDMV